MLRKSPIAKRPMILPILLKENGFVLDIAKGTAISMMNTKEGNTKSAGLSPSQFGCFIHHGASGPLQSTIIIPTIVSPLKISNEFNLCFSLLTGTI